MYEEKEVEIVNRLWRAKDKWTNTLGQVSKVDLNWELELLHPHPYNAKLMNRGYQKHEIKYNGVFNSPTLILGGAWHRSLLILCTCFQEWCEKILLNTNRPYMAWGIMLPRIAFSVYHPRYSFLLFFWFPLRLWALSATHFLSNELFWGTDDSPPRLLSGSHPGASCSAVFSSIDSNSKSCQWGTPTFYGHTYTISRGYIYLDPFGLFDSLDILLILFLLFLHEHVQWMVSLDLLAFYVWVWLEICNCTQSACTVA